MTREEIISGFDTENNIVHIPEEFPEEKARNAVIFAHILKAGGSQAALESLIPLLIERDCNIYVVTCEDGIYRDRLVENFGITVVIQNDYVIDEGYRHFLQTAFDLVILNANPSGAFGYYFINTSVPVLYWMHECIRVIAEEAPKYVPHHCLTSDNFHYLIPWKRTLREFEECYGRKAMLLPINVEDVRHERKANDKTVFLFPGAYMNFKGFPLALEAIFKLPKETFIKCKFIFCGYVVDKKLYEEMRRIAGNFDNIEVLPDVTREEMQRLQDEADCVVIPSLIDAGPLTAVEGLMHGNLCIVSDKAGIADYLTDCVDALVYPGDSTDELYKRMLLAASDITALKPVAERGRQVYLNHFTLRQMEECLDEILENI